jgi:hypothetical protein
MHISSVLSRVLRVMVCLSQAEARLAAKRQARAEAREIRMRELERLQRESEDNDRVYDIYSSPGTHGQPVANE